MSEILIIVPTYNEIDNVEAIASAVSEALPEAHMLFVDDGSPDGTGKLLDELSERDERIQVMHRQKKEGLGRAYIAGFKWALERSYALIVEMDADFSHDPKALPDFIGRMQGADLVVGSRYVGGIRVINWPLSRLVLSKGAGLYVRIITGMPFTDPTSGFKCFRRCVLEDMALDGISASGYSFQIELNHRAWRRGFRVEEMPIVFEERRSGQSKMSASIIREALWLVWKVYLRAGLRRKAGKTHPKSITSSQST